MNCKSDGYFERPVREGETLIVNGTPLIFYRCPKRRRLMARIGTRNVKVAREVTDPVRLDSADAPPQDMGIDP